MQFQAALQAILIYCGWFVFFVPLSTNAQSIFTKSSSTSSSSSSSTLLPLLEHIPMPEFASVDPSIRKPRETKFTTWNVPRGAGDVNHNHEGGYHTSVVGGIFAKPERYPYLVSLAIYNWQTGSQHFCGGSFIAPDIILSAAHCVETGIPFRIESGHTNRTSESQEYEVFVPHRVWMHPRYYNDADAGVVAPYDYCIIHLYDETSKPFVNVNFDPSLPGIGVEHTAVGWGLTSNGGKASPVLKETELDVVNCPYNFADTTICAARDGTDVCQGDSGGPLLFTPTDDPSDDVVVGLVSFTVSGCASSFPSGFAVTSRSSEWITNMVCQYSVNPPAAYNCPSINRRPPSQGEFINPVIVRFTMDLDSWPEERGWSLQGMNTDGFLVTYGMKSDYFYALPSSTVEETIILEDNTQYFFNLLDSAGDGNARETAAVTFYVTNQFGDEEFLGTLAIDTNGWYSLAFAQFTLGVAITPEAPSMAPSTTAQGTRQQYLTVIIKFDSNPGQTGFYLEELFDDDTPPKTVYEVMTGTYGNELANQQIEQVIPLPMPTKSASSMSTTSTTNDNGGDTTTTRVRRRLKSEQTFRFSITDRFADGLFPGGSYEIYLGSDQLIHSGSSFLFEDTVTFNVEPLPTPAPSFSAVPSMFPSTSPSMSPTIRPTPGASQRTGTATTLPVDVPSLTPSQYTTTPPTSTAKPTNLQSSEPTSSPSSSSIPSVLPSDMPSVMPTGVPSYHFPTTEYTTTYSSNAPSILNMTDDDEEEQYTNYTEIPPMFMNETNSTPDDTDADYYFNETFFDDETMKPTSSPTMRPTLAPPASSASSVQATMPTSGGDRRRLYIPVVPSLFWCLLALIVLMMLN